MNYIDFLDQFNYIWRQLTLMAPGFQDKQSFLALLKHLSSNKLVSKGTFNNLFALWHAKNKIIASPKDMPISKKLAEKLISVKKNLINKSYFKNKKTNPRIKNGTSNKIRNKKNKKIQ